jgi:hypothetical protein
VCGNAGTGNVSVGLATYSSTSVLATPLLKRVRQEYPHVNLFMPVVRRVVEPTIQATVSLCVPDQNQLSDSALAVADILAQLVRELASSGQAHGISEAQPAQD